jgi:hypothetical protein
MTRDRTRSEQTILIIRHAEKPEPPWGMGVNQGEIPDEKSLAPRGWQRAGAWAELFAPSLGGAASLSTPTRIFASAYAKHVTGSKGNQGGKSRRPEETVAPLADKLGLEVDLTCTKGQERDLVTALAKDGVALVCWQHDGIPDIARALAPGGEGIPREWPKNCYNVIFRLRRPDGASASPFDQVAPVMLKGDGPAAI